MRSLVRQLLEAGDTRTSTANTTPTMSSARNVSQQMTHVVSVVTERLHRHDCGVHAARNSGEPDEAEIRLRVSRRFQRKDARVAYTPTIVI